MKNLYFPANLTSPKVIIVFKNDHANTLISINDSGECASRLSESDLNNLIVDTL